MYYIGGGYAVPVDSEYLGCMRDEKVPTTARAIFEGLLKCKGTMTVQVTAICGRQYLMICSCSGFLSILLE